MANQNSQTETTEFSAQQIVRMLLGFKYAFKETTEGWQWTRAKFASPFFPSQGEAVIDAAKHLADHVKNGHPSQLAKETECYACFYRTSVPGDAHIGCSCPDGSMEGSEHGIKKGWFFYPVCFDPAWKKHACLTFAPNN